MLSNTISKSLRSVVSRSTVVRSMATVPPPRLFDYQQVTSNLKPCIEMVDAIENCFGKLAKDEVDVPIPMHIGIDETSVAGPGDCHIKGGYISGTRTWTVKLANVSFYKNLERGFEYAERVDKSDVWTKLAKAQLDQRMTHDAITSYVKANDATNFVEVIKTCIEMNSIEKEIEFLKDSNSPW